MVEIQERLDITEPLSPSVTRGRRKMVKQRSSDSTRTYDEQGLVLRAACVCVKDGNENEVLLVSGGRDSDRWIVPGGGIEQSEEAWTAALREVKEEAGVIGTLDRCLGVFEIYFHLELRVKLDYCINAFDPQLTKNNKTLNLMDEWEESQSIGRKRKWFSLEEARRELSQYRPAHCVYLDQLTASRHSSNNAHIQQT